MTPFPLERFLAGLPWTALAVLVAIRGNGHVSIWGAHRGPDLSGPRYGSLLATTVSRYGS
ncbi:hypothetical protein [Arthrobacter sp. NPDC093139]|uniref:hypothetical protein n=1 Tax=Arthrobacter sp. NPDC093139 TaxID=3363945 RepID=UPI003826663A